MHPRSTAILSALVAAAMLSAHVAPARADPPPWAPAWGWRAKHRDGNGYRGTVSCNRELLGTVVGAGVGAAAGSQIGKGDGRIAAVVVGTIIGGLVGGSVGRSMDQADVRCFGQALEDAQTGQTITWRNPAQSADYRVTPTRSYQAQNGRYCREYTATSVIGGREQQTYGTACRQPDGSWQIQN